MALYNQIERLKILFFFSIFTKFCDVGMFSILHLLNLLLLGLLKDFVVEMIPQSPFMSLTTALFDAVADLNHQNIYPNKDILYEYLRKRYPDIKTPETKVIHECLGRLIKNRRLYHNGRGYFILMNENILNEVIALKESSTNRHYSDCSSYEPSILGFSFNTDSRTSSSGQTDGHTDLDSQMSHNKFSFNHNCDISVSDVHISDFQSSVDQQKAIIPEQSVQKSLSSRFFRRNNSKSDKYDKKSDAKKTSKGSSKIFSCGLGGTPTDSIILSNGILESPCKISSMDKKRDEEKLQQVVCNTIKNEDAADSVFSDETLCNESESIHTGDTHYKIAGTTGSTTRKKVKRSKSFSGKSNRSKSQKEVSFALVGAPNLRNKDWSSDSEIEASSYFKKRSFSFGVGYSRNVYHRPQTATVKSIPTDCSHGNGVSCDNIDQSLDVDEYGIYSDLQSSFVDDSVALCDPDNRYPENMPVLVDEKQRPDMLPINGHTLDMIHNYKDLGSALSLPTADRGNHLTMKDLLSPTKEESLAEELKEAYNDTKPLAASESKETEDDDDELSSIDIKLLSPRSRRKLGTPYESQYITEVLKQSEQVCKALEESKKDSNSNYLHNKTNDRSSKKTAHSNRNKPIATSINNVKDGGTCHDKKQLNSSAESGGVHLRTKSKSTEDRKSRQKERNSQLFEEKRASLKVMGMV